ncbi:MAG: glucose 1-dehydrogenase [Dehalococcoidia bacterium]|nr:glucose 1-dehydrogenase [Dehalococcoidia bacterium]
MPTTQVAYRPICNIYFGVGPDRSGLMNLVPEVRNEYFPRYFFSIRQGGPGDWWQSRYWEAIAVGLAKLGADVAVTSRKLPDLEEVAKEINGLGRRSMAVATHVGRTEEINNLVPKVKDEFGRIDILVNNAGTNPTMASAIDIEERAWDAIMNLNLRGLFFLSQAVARVMKEQGGGKIINVASVAGITPDILPVYSISKAGVIMATKVMAQQWAQYNIRVNAIAPGLTKTRFSEALWGNPAIEKAVMERTPLRRVAEPDEMVGAVIFLASDASSYVTGHILVVDGGAVI